MSSTRQKYLLAALLVSWLLPGCGTRPVAEMDEVYYDWDGERVLCAVSVDDANPDAFVPSLDNLRGALERARDRDEVLLLYAHEPGATLSLERLEDVLALVDEVGLPFATFDELYGPPQGAGVALTFDDAHIDEWHGQRELFAAYGARVTFFVTRFHRLSTQRIEMLRALYDDGHAIESHSANHLDAVDYVAEHGLQAYIADEVLPSLDDLRRAGFHPTTFAYPFGSRTSQIDRAVLEHVELVRSISYAARTPFVSSPCPR